MSSVTLPPLLAAIIQTCLGLAVFQSNPRRRANQAFLLLSAAIIAWLTSLYFAFITSDTWVATIAMRQASASAVLIFTAFNFLRLSIRDKPPSWRSLIWKMRYWLLAALGMVIFCQTSFYLEKAIWHPQTSDMVSLPTPIYGRGFPVYLVYFVGAIIALLFGTIRDLRATVGREHAELAFVLIVGILTLVLSLPLTLILGRFVEPSKVLWFAPFRVFVFSLVVAYGIATRKIMEVGVFFRRVMSYTVLGAYLLAVYAVVWWLVGHACRPVFANASGIAHVTAAIVVAFSMAPARGLSQSLADRLFVGTRQLDFRTTMNRATAILRSVSTLNDLLDRFAKTIGEAVDVGRIFILLPSKHEFAQQYPPPTSGARLVQLKFDRDEPLIQYLTEHPEPVVLDELRRIRPTPQLDRIARQMQHLEIAVVLGIFSREHLAGVMLLGPRLSGRIFGTVEQNALQVLCGQLAVAIENAQLFTEVQNAKIYNETLLHNMTTGVIAASADGYVTVFNNEAEQITGLRAGDLLDQPISWLSKPVRALMEETLRTGELQADRELVLQVDEGNIIARASSSIFHDQAGDVLGALVVLTDITHLKRLEMQIRRSDRLASLGTLSAGMAHEIKNPLVSIKTFAQLLPERYQDSDFRETFSNLIGHEIDRIDSLVNQLLRFARPAKPLLKPMHVHDVLEKSLMLVAHRLYQKGIKLSRCWNADVDTIRADADQMEQVFLNFFLNAMDAMKEGGELTVTTEIRSASEWVSPAGAGNGYGEILRVSVRDNGEGIQSEHLAHVFDPFFTTKDYGTGLGLSVVHGIIQEHGGQIEVESELRKGTAFHILLPLVRFDEEVVAA
ncbi:MAG TPA: ATP-binding protein [Chthoniobacterales bacterium]